MKLIIFLALFASLVITYQVEAKSFNEKDKRFLFGGISIITDTFTNIISTITDTVINPVVDVVNNGINTIGSGINTAINTITAINVNDAWNAVVDVVWKPVENTAVDIWGQATGGVSTIVDNVGNFITILTGGATGSTGEQQAPDFCSYKCKAVNQAGVEFFYDQPNGCASKGFSQLPYNFNSCCDSHNYCLNTRCCTTDCQQFKDNCDMDYKRCLRAVCSNLSDFDEMDKCISIANLMANTAGTNKCNVNESRNRKLCIC